MEPTDASLISGVLRGDPDTASLLCQRYARPLYHFIHVRTGRRHHDTEDLTQEAFVEAIRNIRVFDQNRDFWLWLCGIARRRLAGHHRRNRLRTPADPSGDAATLLELADGDMDFPEEILARKESRELLGACFATIPPRYQNVLEGKYIRGDSLEQMGHKLGITSEAVSSRLQRARATLKHNIVTTCKEIVESD